MQIKEMIDKISPAGFAIQSMPDRDKLRQCRNIKKIPDGAKSVIIMSFPYYSKELKGNISKYAMVPDYHRVIGNILKRACESLNSDTSEFVSFVDNSPLDEVKLAISGGLGYRGRNGLLIDEHYGSYVFLGSIVTNLELDETCKSKGDCIGCRRCEKACPGQALSDGKIDKRRCFSYITQQKNPPTKQQEEIMKKYGLLWGCDICQDVCPMNKNIKETYIKEFLKDIVTVLDENNIADKTRAFSYRGEKVIKRNLDILN